MENTVDKALLERWGEAVGAAGRLPGPDWLTALRAAAAQQFLETGLPDRKVED